MHIVITGGAGFLGQRLARALLAAPTIQLAGAAASLTRLTLVDRAAPDPGLAAMNRVHVVTGELDTLLLDTPEQVLPPDTDAIIHLAAAVSGECEADLLLGLRSNLDATRALLLQAGGLARPPVFVFSSSLAVYGAAPGHSLPALITDDTLPTPQNSYGIQKFMCEQLVADCSRRGLVQGRTVRLMTVAVRPGKPNAAASSFLSGMIREPLAGLPARCPVPPATPVALSTPARAIEGLLRALQASSAEWGAPTAVNLPAISTTPAEMAAAVGRAAGPAATALIDWTIDERISTIVAGWPARFNTARATALGLLPDASVDALVQAYIADTAAA